MMSAPRSILYMALPSIAISFPDRRQSDGAVAESIFYRRGYQYSAVLDNVVYIDGGQVSYTIDGSVTYSYSSTLLSIDLSEDWTNDTLTVGSITKPSGAPDLVRGGLWVDTTNQLLYSGFAGDISLEFGLGDEPAQPSGLWSFSPAEDTWTNLNGSAASALQTEARPFSGSVASGGGAGYHLGGFIYDSGGNKTIISGLLTYNFDNKTLTNTTVSGVTSGGRVQKGHMLYVPNFGPDGVLVSLGGSDADTGELYSMSSIEIYDPNNQVWYSQDTTGAAPESRIEFCLTGAASTNRTFDILVYAGWDGTDTSSGYDEAFILSLPSFHWFKADYASTKPRHGLTCEHAGGGQVLTIGGVDTSQVGTSAGYQGPFSTVDPFKQGLAIFDMSTLSFASSYTASRTDYTMSETIQYYYDTNAREADFSSTGLKNVFSVENFTYTYNTSSASNTSTTSNDYHYHNSDTGAIVGGVVGSVGGLALLAGLAFFLLRRRRRAQAAADSAARSATKESTGQNLPMYDYTKAIDANQVFQELPPSRHVSPMATEAFSSPVYEAPGQLSEPHELP